MSSTPRTFLTGSASCTLVVCRGCCCGDARKNPGTDHAWQLELLRAGAAEHGFQVRTTDCLGPCDQSNVIVVRPSAAGRRAGAKAAWIGFVTDDEATEEVVRWAAAGGPGVAAPPLTLELQFIEPPREARVRSRRRR
ncbi:(2Fe-2S) ferredoxin domain-containing protein [Streptomyces griseorubiginosus]|uniref:(2Fe-2S) ferredoxin domain-containing protein n=1 Tax=Streptomyces griseorubiginosus TaxID=67304 RepID=UPI0011403D75|nr:(2Fe-2S) ferredoxin domain-containing protein [Streptomyces griseorubiginosus]